MAHEPIDMLIMRMKKVKHQQPLVFFYVYKEPDGSFFMPVLRGGGRFGKQNSGNNR